MIFVLKIEESSTYVNKFVGFIKWSCICNLIIIDNIMMLILFFSFNMNSSNGEDEIKSSEEIDSGD